MLEEMKSKFPLSYEIYRIMKTEYAVHKAQKKAIRIHNMSNEELMAYDANLYKKWMGRDLDWNNLQTFTEKMQWAKLFDDDPRKVICADKYAVRSWVKEKIGEEYLIPLLGKWERYSEINFDSLPERFVIKTNHGSGDAIIVRNKSRMTFDEKLEMRRKIKAALRTDFGAHLCEMHYSKISPLIIAEKYLESGEEYLRDYKFQCFDGKIAFCYVDIDRFTKHRRNVYDRNWNLLDWNTGNYENSLMPIEKPQNYDEMIEVVEKLANNFTQIRIDLYNVCGKLYFGEMTFTPASGFHQFTSYEADKALGKLWNLKMI